MEWSRIKTILIWVFVMVNIFLFATYFKGIYTGNRISDETLENTAIILKNNNISLDKDILDGNYSNAKICTVENKYNTISAMLENARKNAQDNGEKYISEENTKIRGNTFTSAVNSDLKISNIEKHVKKEMEKTGLLKNVSYKTVVENDGIYFYLKFDNKVFYDSYIRVVCTQKGIQEIYGHNWLGDVISDGGIAEAMSPAEILVNFALNTDYKNNVTVTEMEKGYYIGERFETLRVTAFPVWKITVSDGKSYFYDMRNGDLLDKPV